MEQPGMLCNLVGSVLGDVARARDVFCAWFAVSAAKDRASPLDAIVQRIVTIVTAQINVEIVCERASARCAGGRAVVYVFGRRGRLRVFAVPDTLFNERELAALDALAARPDTWAAAACSPRGLDEEALRARDDINDALDAGLDRGALVHLACYAAVLAAAASARACARLLNAALTRAAADTAVRDAGYADALLDIARTL